MQPYNKLKHLNYIILDFSFIFELRQESIEVLKNKPKNQKVLYNNIKSLSKVFRRIFIPIF